MSTLTAPFRSTDRNRVDDLAREVFLKVHRTAFHRLEMRDALNHAIAELPAHSWPEALLARYGVSAGLAMALLGAGMVVDLSRAAVAGWPCSVWSGLSYKKGRRSKPSKLPPPALDR